MQLEPLKKQRPNYLGAADQRKPALRKAGVGEGGSSEPDPARELIATAASPGPAREGGWSAAYRGAPIPRGDGAPTEEVPQ